MLFDQGKLEKLTIRAYRPRTSPTERPVLSDAEGDSYVVQVNPNSYTVNYAIAYTDNQAQGASGSDAVYDRSEPVTLNFEFLFDGTGVVPASSALSDIPLVGAIASALGGSDEFNVLGEIEKFNTLVCYFDGVIHRPRELQLVWGQMTFDGVLTTLSYRFPLFKPDGTPLRAVASCGFRESWPDALRLRQDNASSPDLTHLRDVREGDTLPLLAYGIYGSPDYYLEVARVNKLVNFRRLKTATRLAFPPLDKGSTP